MRSVKIFLTFEFVTGRVFVEFARDEDVFGIETSKFVPKGVNQPDVSKVGVGISQEKFSGLKTEDHGEGFIGGGLMLPPPEGRKETSFI